MLYHNGWEFVCLKWFKIITVQNMRIKNTLKQNKKYATVNKYAKKINKILIRCMFRAPKN